MSIKAFKQNMTPGKSATFAYNGKETDSIVSYVFGISSLNLSFENEKENSILSVGAQISDPMSIGKDKITVKMEIVISKS
jgi:hypothetical protein